jgi:TatD DNase family protein
MQAFDSDRDSMLRRARAAGISSILTASTSLADARRNTDLASEIEEPKIWSAVGVHPHEAKGWRDGDEERLRSLVARDRVVAIGEAGLDYHYDSSPRDQQREVLIRQVRLSASLRLPIVIHCREAAADTAAILEGEGACESGGVLHCFTENADFAERCLKLGFYVSFSGILTFRNAGAIREVARFIPEDRLLVETDSPYLAPVPHRGKRNEPAYVSLVLEDLARIRNKEPASLAVTIKSNFERLIGHSVD